MNGVPFDTVHAALRDRGWDPTETTKGLRARCPAHGGTRDSLVVSRLDDGGAEMYCHSKKCSDHAVMRALELDPATRKRRRLPPDSKASCTWSYFDAAGNEVGRVLRWDFEGGAKEVRPRRPDGRGGWVKKKRPPVGRYTTCRNYKRSQTRTCLSSKGKRRQMLRPGTSPMR